MKRKAVIGLLLIGAVATGGCGAQSAPPVTPSVSIAPVYKAYIDRALADPELTDFERQVLSDYQITDAEYQGARDLYMQCIADNGWAAEAFPDGSYQYWGEPGTANADMAIPSQVLDGCDAHTTRNIEGLYWGMLQNPTGLTGDQQIRACYAAHGVPDGAGLSEDAFGELLRDPTYRPSTPAAMVCMYDPNGSLGMTREQAESIYTQGHPHAT